MEQEMKYIYEVYQQGTFSKAAEQLYLTQSALSMAVHRVEKELGSEIFNRSKRPLELTPVGELYIQKYHQIALLEKELQKQINDLNLLNSGTLSLGGTQYIFSCILAPVLAQFQKKYPQVEIQLVERSSNQLPAELSDGNIDFFLKCDEVTAPFQTIGHAFYDRLLLAMPRSFVEEYQLPECGFSKDIVLSGAYHSIDYDYMPFSCLDQIPFLILSAGNNLHDRTLLLFSENNITPNIVLELSQMVTAYHLAIKGLGCTLTTEGIIRDTESPDMIFYKLNSPLTTREFRFISGTKSYISRVDQIFMEMVQAYYQKF